MDQNSLPSVWTACVTPMDAKGDIDRKSFEYLLRKQESAGNGILLFGSTGEALAFRDDERLAALEWICKLELRVPLMVGVGGFQLPEVLKWLRACEDLPLHSYLMPTPYYAKPGPWGQQAWFAQLLDTVRRPCMLYNIPGRSAVKLSIKAVRSVIDHENLWALKEASGSDEDFASFVEAFPQLQVYSGNDAWFPPGAVGAVSVISNAWPRAMRRYVRQCLEGTADEATHKVWREAADAACVCNPVSVKSLLHLKEWITTPYLRPPLHVDDGKSPAVLRKQEERVAAWEGQQKKEASPC